MNTIRNRIACVTVASVLALGFGVGAAPALAGSQAWSGRPAPSATEVGAYTGGGGAASGSGAYAQPGVETPDNCIRQPRTECVR